MSRHCEEWLAAALGISYVDDSRVLLVSRVEHPGLLLFQDDGSTVVVPSQIEIKTVMHQVSAADGPYLLHLPGINGFDFINRILGTGRAETP